MNEIGPNFIARPYRGVSVQDVETLDDDALLAHVRSRRVYRRTEFIVATCGERRAIVQVEREDGDAILSGVRGARILARPDEVAFVEDESVDTGNASQLARVAERDARVTIVQGRFQHVNFIVAPAPTRIRVLEVVPPHPPKLLEMARAVLDFDEELPPVELDYEPIDMRELARGASHYLFPCRCSGLELEGARVDFLDAGPPRVADWTLVGCERSRQIHEALYGADPSARIDFCPRLTPAGEGPTLLKCCLLERGIERDGERLVVPWGATLEEVRSAIHMLV